jgi:hypothetical protein
MPLVSLGTERRGDDEATMPICVKLVVRAHQSLFWDRTGQVLRLRSALREFFPAALHAFDDLSAGEALELLDRAPGPRSRRTAAPDHDRRRLAPGRSP